MSSAFHAKRLVEIAARGDGDVILPDHVLNAKALASPEGWRFLSEILTPFIDEGWVESGEWWGPPEGHVFRLTPQGREVALGYLPAAAILDHARPLPEPLDQLEPWCPHPGEMAAILRDLGYTVFPPAPPCGDFSSLGCSPEDALEAIATRRQHVAALHALAGRLESEAVEIEELVQSAG